MDKTHYYVNKTGSNYRQQKTGSDGLKRLPALQHSYFRFSPEPEATGSGGNLG